MRMSEAVAPRRRSRLRTWIRRLFLLGVAAVLVSVLQVLALRWIPPLGSAFMIGRQVDSLLAGEWRMAVDYRWRPSDRISASLPIALVAAEDQKFPLHRGFDMEAIEKALKNNAKGKKVRGASTITQQLAKNLFLWQGRSWVRKGLEAWYTVLLEMLLPKHRILELYANVAEFGDGVYGAEAAAQRFFGKPAAKLSGAESARLAAVLPNPKKYSASKPGPKMRERAAWIQRQVGRLGGASYLATTR
jgi:monofunctional biosynthetic peptidoglycan transglycosylase